MSMAFTAASSPSLTIFTSRSIGTTEYHAPGAPLPEPLLEYAADADPPRLNAHSAPPMTSTAASANNQIVRRRPTLGSARRSEAEGDEDGTATRLMASRCRNRGRCASGDVTHRTHDHTPQRRQSLHR